MSDRGSRDFGYPQSEIRKSEMLRLGLFSEARTPQDVAERVVAFVARVLEQQVAGGRPHLFTRPRPLPRGRIFDAEPIAERLRIDSREALDDVQVLARAAETRLVGAIRRIHHERV